MVYSTGMIHKNGMSEPVRAYVGKVGTIKLEGLEFSVIIKDYKKAYGKNRFLITPQNGKGVKWAENILLKRA